MLNWDEVLYYVKRRIALPSSYVEATDAELKRYIITTALRTFSDYFPDIDWAVVYPTNPSHITDQKNIYKFFDSEDLSILGVRNYYFSDSSYFATGNPIWPAFSIGGSCAQGSEVAQMAIKSLQSNMLRPFSAWGYTGKFIRPNYVRILPTIDQMFVVEYERGQPHDLRKIPGEHERDFMDLALAEIMIWIGTIRTHYGQGQISTPFGDIPLQGDMLKNDGNELRRETIERLREASIPGVFMST
jgi:hypothetical protein